MVFTRIVSRPDPIFCAYFEHGYHHRHYFGVVEAVDFVSFEDIENRFECDWLALRKKL